MTTLVTNRTLALSRLTRPLAHLKFKRAQTRVLPIYVTVRQNSEHRVILIPEVPRDTAETNVVLQNYASTNWPNFDQITERDSYFGLGKTLLEFEGAVATFEEKCAQGVMDFDELFKELEAAKCQMEFVWSTVNLMHLVSDKLDGDRFMLLHERAEMAMMTRNDSQVVYDHMLNMKAAHQEKPFLKPFQEQMIDRYITEHKMQGYGLPALKKEELHSTWMKKLRQVRREYLYKMMRNNERFHHTVTNPTLVQDFPINVLKAMAHDSSQPSKGPWSVTLHPYIFKQFLAYCPERSLRYNAHYADVTRGSKAVDNYTAVQGEVKNIRQYKLDQAVTLGHKSYADMSMVSKMADSVDSVKAMISNLAGKAKQRQEMELEALQNFANTRGQDEDLEVYDVDYWTRKQRRTILGMSDEDLRDFFPLPKVVEGIFKLFEELFNVKFQQIEGDFPKWHEDLTLFAVQDAKSGQTLGHFYFDPFIRDEKGYAGADKGWYVPIKTRSKVGPSLPLGAIVMALPPPNYGKPSLLNFSEAKEVLRNFGGLLQHVLTENEYSDTCGTIGLEGDVIEFATQFISEWIYHPDVLNLMSGHWTTNEPLKEETVNHLCTTIKHHMAGYKLCEELFKADFDISYHSAESDSYIDIEENLRKKYLLLPKVDGDESPVYFSDMIGGSQGATYFCSIWSRMLAADAFSAVNEAIQGSDSKGKVYELPEVKHVANKFRTTFLAAGSSRPMAELFRQFRGRDPSHEALLFSLGLKRKSSPKMRSHS